MTLAQSLDTPSGCPAFGVHFTENLQLPRAALESQPDLSGFGNDKPLPQTAIRPFQDPDPFHEFTYPTVLAGRRAIADYLAQPLARLSSEQLAFIDELLAETLQKKVILQRVRDYFYPSSKEDSHAH